MSTKQYRDHLRSIFDARDPIVRLIDELEECKAILAFLRNDDRVDLRMNWDSDMVLMLDRLDKVLAGETL